MEAHTSYLTNIERRQRRLPQSDDHLMRSVAISLLAEIRILHGLIEAMAMAIPREQMNEAEGQMLDVILGNL